MVVDFELSCSNKEEECLLCRRFRSISYFKNKTISIEMSWGLYLSNVLPWPQLLSLMPQRLWVCMPQPPQYCLFLLGQSDHWFSQPGSVTQTICIKLCPNVRFYKRSLGRNWGYFITCGGLSHYYNLREYGYAKSTFPCTRGWPIVN